MLVSLVVVRIRNELKMLVVHSFVKTGFITGKQALMTPSKASRQVRRAIIAYCCCVFCALMFVVITIRTTVMAQMLYETSAWVSPPFWSRFVTGAHATPIENIPVMTNFFFIGI